MSEEIGRSGVAVGLSSDDGAASVPNAEEFRRSISVVNDPDVGLDGGYRLMVGNELIATIERFYPTWERGPKGRMWVTARGTCKRAEYRIREPLTRYPTTRRTLKEAVHHVAAQAIEARRAETGTGSVHESAVAKPCAQ